MPQSARDRLKSRFKHIVNENDGEHIKLWVGALIDILGLRETSHGGARLFGPNPVIMVNATGKATAEDVLCLTRSVRIRIFEETGLSVQIEPELVGFTREEQEYYLGPAQEHAE
jgi:UDP-N-acetylenolpyruvoylglucosamine reductase